MPRIDSAINTSNPLALENRNHMLDLIETLNTRHQAIVDKTNEAKDKFSKRNQLLPYERVSFLLDANAPFLEIASLAGFKMHDDKDGLTAGGGIIGGIGFIHQQACVIYCNNSAIKGGSISPMGLKKTLRLQEIAMENKLPMVYLVESAGANLNYQADVFIEGGKCFANQAKMSALGIPQITVVHGSCTAGGAYLVGLSDYVIAVKKQAKIFLAGPPLLKAATGEIATDEELGGAAMHASISGTAEYCADNDKDGISIARELIAKLYPESITIKQEDNPPHYPIEELASIIPKEIKTPYDVREVIARLVDNSNFLAFKEDYDSYLICGHAAINGYACGILGNNGPITNHGATKAAQFIQLCCQANIPIIYLQNTTGFMVGKNEEQGGIIKHGSKMLQALVNASVMQITLVIGGSYGAGNYGMCGRGMGPNFIFSWPNSRTSVMGSEQAASVMAMVTQAKMAKKGIEVPKEKLKAIKDDIIKKMDHEANPYYTSARLYDDGIINPLDSRKILALLLSLQETTKNNHTQSASFGVARF